MDFHAIADMCAPASPNLRHLLHLNDTIRLPMQWLTIEWILIGDLRGLKM